MYVEDDQMHVMLVSSLKIADCEFAIANSLEAAKYVYNEFKPDLVITDYNLSHCPDENGDAVVRWLYQQNFKNIIGYTGNVELMRKNLMNYDIEYINKTDYEGLVTAIKKGC